MTEARKITIIKSAITFFLIIFVSTAETTLFPYIKIMGVVPNLLIFIVAAVAVFEGPAAGLVCCAAAGFFADGISGQSYCYYTVFMVITGALVGSISPSLFRKRLTTTIGWGTLFWFICEFLRFFFSVYLFGKSGFISVFTIIVPSLIYSLIMSPIVIFPVFLMYRKMKREPGLFR